MKTKLNSTPLYSNLFIAKEWIFILFCTCLSLSSFKMIAQQDSIRTYSSFGIFDKVIDRFGRDHRWSDLRLDSITTSNVLIESAGIFDLYFFEGCGLEDSSNTIHNQRKAVIKELFTVANDVWTSSTISGRIPIRFLPQTADDSLPSGFPILASSFYCTPAFTAHFSEVSDCVISQMINGGKNPYYSLANYSTQKSMSGGLISFSMLDFYTDFDTYQLNTNLQVSAVSAGTYDFYSISLRELLIGLGVNSLMRINTESLSTNTFQYSRFDEQIKWQNQSILIYQPSLKKYIPNPLVDFSSFLITGTSNCDSIVPCSASPYVADSTIRLHSSYCFEPGIDLCYIQSDCSNLPSVLSSDWGMGTVRRRITADDVKLLCAIGYSINGCFGDSAISNNFCGSGLSSSNVHSVNFSGLTSNGSYKYVVTDSLEAFALGDLIINYEEINLLEDLDIFGTANPRMVVGDSLFLTNYQRGYQIIRFKIDYQNSFPTSQYLLVKYRGGGGGCEYDGCNFISNSSFEDVANLVLCGPIGATVESMCWNPWASTSPDIYNVNCPESLFDFQGNGFGGIDNSDIPLNTEPSSNSTLHLISRRVLPNNAIQDGIAAEEAVQSELQFALQEGTTYQMSLRVLRRPTLGIPVLRIFLRSGEYAPSGNEYLIDGEAIDLIDIYTNPIVEEFWQTISFSFVCTQEGLDHIVLHNEGSSPLTSPTIEGFRSLLIDNVQLTLVQPPVAFNIPQDFVCNNAPLTSLQNFGTPGGGVVTGPGVIGNTSFTFVPGLAGPGTHEITYTVTTPDGCQLTASDFITVHPTVSFGTPLVTPTCGQSCSGSLSVNPTLSPTTTTAAVTYTWTGPSINAANQNLLSLTNLCAGTYTLTAVVNGDCISQQNYVVPSAAPPTASASVSFDICNVSCNSTIQVTTNNPSNTISWTGGLNGFNPTSVCPGIYTATVTNPQGCSTSIQVNVTPSAGPDLTISGTQTLNGSNLGYNTIIVESGAYLTIVTPSGPLTIGNRIEVQSGGRLKTTSANIRFLPQAMVRVRRGGRAYIQGGVLTAHCPGTFWHGIEVLGNSANDHVAVLTSMQNFESADTDGNNDQGGLLIDKLALIERAQIGVRLFTGNMPNPGSNATNSGGYIRAHEVTFRNNTRDLASSTMTHDNKSRLSRVSFELNQNSLNTSWNIRPRVELHNTRGISFEGCTWSNTNTNLLNGNGSNVFQMTGLLMLFSSCIVTEHIAGTTKYKNKFDGFIYGILNSGQCPTDVVIQFTDFKCYRGIYATLWGEQSTVRHCTFNNLNTAPLITMEIPPAFINSNSGTIWNNSIANSALNPTDPNAAPSHLGPAYGLYLNASGSTVIEYNDFNITSTNEANQRVGCYVNNCGEARILIHENTFRGNTFGLRSFNVNRNTSASDQDGTILSCNEFNENRRHLEINANSVNPSAGINSNIYLNGNTSRSNIFRINPNTVFTNGRRIFATNVGQHTLLTRWAEIFNTWTQINGLFTGIVSFPSPLCGTILYNSSRSQMLQNTIEKQIALSNYKDDGQPEYYQSQIQGINMYNLISRYNELMDLSPALSTESILEVLEKEQDIPRSMLLSLLLNNISALKNGNVLDRLEELSEPLSTWEKDSIYAAMNTIDSKEQLQIELNQSLSEYRDQLFKDYLMVRLDTTIIEKDSLLNALLEESYTLNLSRYELLSSMDSMNWSQLSNAVADKIATLKEETHEHKDLSLLAILADQASAIGINKDSLVTCYNGFANDFIQPDFPLTYRMAIAIHDQYDTIPHHGDLEYEESTIETRSFKKSPENTNSLDSIELFPNPANELMQIQTTELNLLDCSIRCLDASGRVCGMQIITKSEKNMVFDVRSLTNGLYTLQITAPNRSYTSPFFISK